MPQSKETRIYRMRNVPSVDMYVEGLARLRPRMNDIQIQSLLAQYSSPARTATATQLAKLIGVDGGHAPVNRQYGRLGRMFCEEMGIEPDQRDEGGDRLWTVWSQGWESPEGFQWQLLPEVTEALEVLGWTNSGGERLAEEVIFEDRFVEGAVVRVVVNRYERNSAARDACIAKFGTECAVCEFSFGSVYGSIAEGFIHVHHLRPISEIAEEYVVTADDLRPVCPNCHAVLHKRSPAFSIVELKEIMADQLRS